MFAANRTLVKREQLTHVVPELEQGWERRVAGNTVDSLCSSSFHMPI